jgi:hypothetical protein
MNSQPHPCRTCGSAIAYDVAMGDTMTVDDYALVMATMCYERLCRDCATRAVVLTCAFEEPHGAQLGPVEPHDTDDLVRILRLGIPQLERTWAH